MFDRTLIVLKIIMKNSTILAWISLVCTGFVAYKVMNNHVWHPSSPIGKKIVKIGIVDMMGPFWDEELILPLYEQYGAEGRKYAADMYMDLPFCDCVFPVFFATTLSLFLYINQPERRWMLLFGLLTGVCDLGENISLMKLLRTYPDFDPIALTIGPKFSLAKHIFLIFSVLGIVQGVILSVIYRSSKETKKD